jgi:hypothetical protein
MRRRSLFAVAAAGPASLILGLDEALAQTPPATVRAALLDQRLSGARDLYDGGDHGRLLGALPGLIADAHAAAGSRRDLDQCGRQVRGPVGGGRADRSARRRRPCPRCARPGGCTPAVVPVTRAGWGAAGGC